MNQTTSAPPRNRRARVMTAIFALVILIPSMLGFIAKFIEFIAVFRGQGEGSFAVTPMVNYLLATTGFFCLFGWALLHGMFREIEAPKQRMLETEEWLDRQEAASDSV
ncbi:MAG: hypothetical protein ACK5TO_18705 [Planctomycetaceae bacterium]|jgi:hypothetical protein